MKSHFPFWYLTALSALLYCDFSHCSPHDIENKLCPGTNPNSYVRDNTKIFSSQGERCSVENDAYILGSMYYKYSSEDKRFEKESIQERWKNVAYLDASLYDNPGNPTGTGLCVFNKRLVKQQSELGLNVALACNPFTFLYCRQEYDFSLSLKDYCDCNYLYSVKMTNVSGPGQIKCYGRAGVPCKFQSNADVTDPFLKLPDSVDCHPSLVCKEHTGIEQRRIFAKAFHGFGINSIVHEYMTENAVAYCDCNSTLYTINSLNECVRSHSETWRSHCQTFSILLFLLIHEIMCL